MNDRDSLKITRQQRKEIRERFKRDNTLITSKLRKYLPIMILTNLSVLLLVSVDGLVVGNLLGAEALSSVNIFYPATVLIGVASDIIAIGSCTCLSLRMGKSDREGLLRAKHASLVTMLVAAVVIGLIQIPVITWLIQSYNLSPAMHTLTWQYAIGVMISMPFGLISTTGAFQLTIVGKMKTLMVLSGVEGIANLVLDLFFVQVMGLGVAGAGYGTACANMIRCAITVICIARNTDIYQYMGRKAARKDFREIFVRGLPEGAYSFMLAFQNYLMMKIILNELGESGGVVRGVCVFALSVALVFSRGIQDSARPLTGLSSGSRDKKGTRVLMHSCFILNLLLIGGFTVICEAAPKAFYHLHGVTAIPENGLFMLRLCAVHFVFKGCNALFRLYFSNQKDSRFITITTVIGNATLPLFAFLLSKMISGTWLWFGYTLTEVLIMATDLIHYKNRLLVDAKEDAAEGDVLYLTVRPEEAVEASRAIRRYADEKGYNKRLSYRVSLCMEEMTAYAVDSQQGRDVHIQIMVRFYDDEAVFVILDDGICIALDSDEKAQQLIVDNYGLLKKVAKSVDYQYVLNMNYTVFTFSA